MTISEYVKLKQYIELNVGKNEKHKYLLNDLKEVFKKDINSPRRLEFINSITEVLAILETRGFLNDDNVVPLKTIAQRLPNKMDLINKIEDYEKAHMPTNLINKFQNSEFSELTISPPKIEVKDQTFTFHPNYMSNGKYMRINQTITEQIGIFWRDLGRNLKIKESIIDEIDKNNQNLPDKAIQILQKYCDHPELDPQHWFFNLCEALEKSRRRDLSKSLQKIMSMNI